MFGQVRSGTPEGIERHTRQIAFSLERKPSAKAKKLDRPPAGWRAVEWRRLLDEGVYASQSDLARGEGVSTAAVSAALKRLRKRLRKQARGGRR